MSTNQNTTQESLKKCSQKKRRINKFITVLTLIFVITSILCVNASAVVLEEVTDVIDSRIPYPTLTMVVENDTRTGYIEVSGAGRENADVYINTSVGEINYISGTYYIYGDDDEEFAFKIAEYYTEDEDAKITELYRNVPLNIDLWEWYENYNDTIIWQLWDYQGGDKIEYIEKVYQIELPYFNNSAIMGTQPLKFYIEENIEYGKSLDSNVYTFNLDLPSIDTIIRRAIEELKQQSSSNITFQYEGEELRNNNYVTDVYAEDGSKITIDFKKALGTVLVQTEYFIVGEVTNIALLNYNDYRINDTIPSFREVDFDRLVILNQFERSAEVTIERQEKEVGLLNWLGNAISGIMNVEIFPNFSLGGILSVIIMIPVVIWILKLVAGG